MELTLGESVRYIGNKRYQEVAEFLFEEALKKKLGANFEARQASERKTWLPKISQKLESRHRAKLAASLYSLTRQEIASQTFTETKDWLYDELGLPKYAEVNKGFHLGDEFKGGVK